ncbi:MAG: hypothetical protein SH809_07975 [Rhodothermales bacterium]|nr:hypothetical protein [Rhodothermales bacterium]
MFFTHSSFWPNLAVCCCLPVALAACEPAQDPDAISPSTAVYFEALMRGQSAAFADTVEMVVRDAESWDALLGRLETLLPMPPVDFTDAMVLLVAVPTPTGGTNIQFDSVEDDGQTWIATYSIGMPARDCRAIDGIAVPFQAVVVPRSDRPVRFEHSIEPYPCTMQ